MVYFFTKRCYNYVYNSSPSILMKDFAENKKNTKSFKTKVMPHLTMLPIFHIANGPSTRSRFILVNYIVLLLVLVLRGIYDLILFPNGNLIAKIYKPKLN